MTLTQTFPVPMKLTDVGTDIAPYLGPEWIMQQKHDGARMLVVYEHGSITFVNGAGKPMTFAAAAQRFEALGEHLLRDLRALGVVSVILDGELIIEDGVYHVFDVLVARLDYDPAVGSEFNPTLVDGSETLTWRDKVLRSNLAALEGPLVKFAITARTVTEKQAMWETINLAGVEGAVSKRLESTWDDSGDPKHPYRTPHWVKHKLVKTADVVVTSVQRTFDPTGKIVRTGKAELAVPIDQTADPAPWVNARGKRLPGVYNEHGGPPATGYEFDPRTMLPVGNASLIGKDLAIEVGSVVEVNYLYFQDAMIQPRIVRLRTDKAAEQCGMDQFPAYTRAVVTL